MAEALRIDGKAVAAELRGRIAAAAARWRHGHAVAPALAVVLVGEDPASQVYVRNKAAATREAGLISIEHRLPATADEAEILALVRRLNEDPQVDGILVQLPLPPQVRAAAVTDAIDPAKDVDGFHVVNTGRLWTTGDGLVPCTPQGCMILLRRALDGLAGRHAVVVGRSQIVGKPMAALLLAADCTVTIAHSRTRELPALCRTADILVAAVGRPEMVRGDWIRPGATVIDVGVNRVTGADGKSRLVGDVAYGEAAAVAGAITPVPGGVGPMTIACLLRNTMLAAARRRGLAAPDV
ncbi:MAG: bifunctional methylenetetrahydrofolate dehydrogenase/methenyltetrahydrofolate cyclohydrolase FolD [Alphaproteobacteria bacterium]|nr:bifunctional methylenetetrahydrofolate dehydrogenase/methenyltetrahydrofolate cyclohydrolase FolD [Alphaproteobacteria bacterium]